MMALSVLLTPEHPKQQFAQIDSQAKSMSNYQVPFRLYPY